MDATTDLNTADASALATDLYKVGRFAEAEGLFRALVTVEPNNVHYVHALAVCLIETDRPADSMPYLERAGILLRDEMLALSANRGKALGEVGRTKEAFAIFDGLVRAAPGEALFWYDRGLMRMQDGDYRGAIVDFDAALNRRPGDGKALFGRGFANLVLGNYADGFRDYECRLKDSIDDPGKPMWTGAEDISGKTILVIGEQGLGDGIMFGRYLPLMVARGAKVLAMMQPPVAPLMRDMAGVTLVGTDPTTWPPFDMWTWSMSLAWCFRTTAESVPAPISLTCDEGRATHWRRRICGRISGGNGGAGGAGGNQGSGGGGGAWGAAGLLGGTSGSGGGGGGQALHTRGAAGGGASFKTPLRVGLVWSGSPKSRYDAHRSIPLAQLAPLFDLPGVQFYSLQVGLRDRDRNAFKQFSARNHAARPLIDLAADLTDFRETAHAMRELDLMVTCDTSVAHLAGTVGVRTLVMLTAFRTYWLWIEQRETSPWYPSIRTIRQETDGDWGPVVARVRYEILAKQQLKDKRNGG